MKRAIAGFAFKGLILFVVVWVAIGLRRVWTFVLGRHPFTLIRILPRHFSCFGFCDLELFSNYDFCTTMDFQRYKVHTFGKERFVVDP